MKKLKSIMVVLLVGILMSACSSKSTDEQEGIQSETEIKTEETSKESEADQESTNEESTTSTSSVQIEEEDTTSKKETTSTTTKKTTVVQTTTTTIKKETTTVTTTQVQTEATTQAPTEAPKACPGGIHDEYLPCDYVPDEYARGANFQNTSDDANMTSCKAWGEEQVSIKNSEGIDASYMCWQVHNNNSALAGSAGSLIIR